MAIIRSQSSLAVILEAGCTFFHHTREQMRMGLVRRKVYRRTYRELSVLPDRSLRDLGIPRSSIKSLAMEAAYDC
ncbi:DUF1127 domain-containing protein [Roseovarius sp. CAU 1744]